MNGDLTGRVALVTGAAGGIGLAIGAGMHAAGATVILADRRGAAEAAGSLGGGRVEAQSLDVADQSSVDQVLASILGRHGGVDILVNAAGVFNSTPFQEVDRTEWRAVLEINLIGLMAMIQGVAPTMMARGYGRIVNVASVGGRRADEKTPVYSASKAGVISVTQSAALALVRYGVTVNALAPGPVRTALWNDLDQAFSRRYLDADAGAFTALARAAIPAGRLAEPDDIVGAALFLCSEASRFVVGQTLNVDGGLILS